MIFINLQIENFIYPYTYINKKCKRKSRIGKIIPIIEGIRLVFPTVQLREIYSGGVLCLLNLSVKAEIITDIASTESIAVYYALIGSFEIFSLGMSCLRNKNNLFPMNRDIRVLKIDCL